MIYYFKLHPSRWEFERDSEIIFQAEQLTETCYDVRGHINGETFIRELYTAKELLEEMLNHQWIYIVDNK